MNPSRVLRTAVLIISFVALYQDLFASNILDSRRRAIQFVQREIASGKVVMLVSLRPGDEDLTLGAYLRYGKGAQLTSVFISNGEAVPATGAAEVDQFLREKRKEEADHACRSLDIRAYFLNLSDPGAIFAETDLNPDWRKAAVENLAEAIRALSPHIVVVMNDMKNFGGSHVLSTTLAQLTKEAVELASKNGQPMTHEGAMLSVPWKVQRIWSVREGDKNSFRVKGEAVDAVAGASYTARARRAGQSYHSRMFNPMRSIGSASSGYAEIFRDFSGPEKSIDEGIAVVSPRFESLRVLAHELSRIDPSQKENLISNASRAIDLIDQALRSSAPAPIDSDRRTLARWKLAIERLRFLAHGVKLEVVVSDSIVAPRQLFFVNVKNFDASMKDGSSFIYFAPRNSADWYINEKKTMQFPVTGPEEFRVLTAANLEFDYPVSTFGLSATTLGIPFDFGIYHVGKTRGQNYSASFEVILQYAPRRIVEITTPVVLWGRDKELGYRAFNTSRDSALTILEVSGEECTSLPETLILRKKDEWVSGAMKLNWQGTSPKSLDTLNVLSSGRLFGSFFVKTLESAVDSSQRTTLITNEPNGSIAMALRRLVPDPAVFSFSDFAHRADKIGSTMIIDRGALTSQSSTDSVESLLMPLIRKGTRVLVFPQPEGIAFDSTRFNWNEAYAATEEVVVGKSEGDILRFPNQITEIDWTEWVHARAWCRVSPGLKREGFTLVESRRDRQPLVWCEQVGHGSITFVALDLEQQLDNLHDGAFRILANLLSLNRCAQ